MEEGKEGSIKTVEWPEIQAIQGPLLTRIYSSSWPVFLYTMTFRLLTHRYLQHNLYEF